jgi:thiamine biosynthesis protein ThiI
MNHPLETNAILVHYGEIALKGKNRPTFLWYLRKNLARKLDSLGLDWPVRQFTSYYYIEVPPDAGQEQAVLDRVLTGLAEVAGVVWYGPAHYIPADTARLLSDSPHYDLLKARAISLAEADYRPGNSFRVSVKRGEKRFPLTSPELEAMLGAAIIKNTNWSQVNLGEPDQTFHVDIRTEGAFFYSTKHPGVRGLPVGVSGRVLVLLSGGIDSPVAAYLAAKRGCPVDFIHFTAAPLKETQAKSYKVSRMAKRLSHFTKRSRLYLIPYTHFELAVLGEEMDYELIIFRRFMTRVAEQLAGRKNALALVTGDNLGQVASQTMENLVANSQAVNLPVLRPLIMFDKQEIIDLAVDIGTYDLSIEPYKDCCSILARNPQTKSQHHFVSQREDTLFPDYDDLISRTLADAICLEYEYGREVG